MAWAFVQSTGTFVAATSTTIAQAFAGNVTAGNLIVVASHWNDTGTTAAATDSLGNTYTSAVGPTNFSTTDRAQVFFAKNITGGACTVTVTLNASRTNRYITIHEYSGLDTATGIDVAAAAAGSSTAPAASVTTTAANDMLFGFAFVANTAGASSGTARQLTNGDATQDQNVVSAGAVTSTLTQTPTGTWVCQAAAFLQAGGAPPPATVKQLSALGVG